MTSLLRTTQIQEPSSTTVNLTLDASGGVTVGQNLTVTGSTTHTGSETAAAFIPSGSTVPTNGLYLPAANSAGIATDSTERLRIDSSGNVGIGTNSPTSFAGYTTLTLNNSTSGGVVALNAAGVNTGLLVGTALNVNLGSVTSIPLLFNTNNTERMRIDSSGRVGIGTSSPSANLDVASTSTTAYSSTAYNGAAARLTLRGGNSTNAFNGIRFSNGASGEALFSTVQDASGYQAFVWQSYNGSYAERMRIDSSGNVGIGTSSPSTALHVVGEITATQGVTGYATFNAASTGTQTVTTGVYTKATLTTVIFNVGGNYASSTFTPTVAGYYQINGICGATAGTAITYAGAAIYKNGSAESVVLCPGYSGTSALASISDIIYCNGTTDYIELYVRVSGTGTLTVNTNTAFSGCLVRGA